MRTSKSEFDHAVGADLDYGFIWELSPGETIESSVWVAPVGVEMSREQIDGNITSVFINLNLENTVSLVTNHIATSEGRTDNRSFALSCKRRFVQ